MDKKQIAKILSKIKDTIGENNYKLALAITGHRTGKIKDIIMCSKDGELLLEYVEHLEQQCKKQKEMIYKAIKELSEFRKYHFIEEDTEYRELNHILETLGVEFEEYI